jgi:Domain of unknown function (DUF4131)
VSPNNQGSPVRAGRTQPFSGTRGQVSAGQPLFWAAFFFSAGICVGKYLWQPTSWWIVAAAAFVGSAIYLSKRRTLCCRNLVLASLLFCGALSLQMRNSATSAESQVWSGEGECVITAHVISEGDIESSRAGWSRQRIDVETERVDCERQTRLITEAVRLSVYQTGNGNSNAVQLFSYGERLRFRATLIPPRNYRNPGAFDYAGYLRDNGIAATALRNTPV